MSLLETGISTGPYRRSVGLRVYLQELCTQVDSIRGCPRLRSASTGCIELPSVGLQTHMQHTTAEFRLQWTGSLEQFTSNIARQ